MEADSKIKLKKSILNEHLKIDSRYDRPGEIIELNNFICMLDAFMISPFVDSVFYDSPCGVAFYELYKCKPIIGLGIDRDVDLVASFTLSQYQDSAGCIMWGAMADE